jgi:hypothetical protein
MFNITTFCFLPDTGPGGLCFPVLNQKTNQTKKKEFILANRKIKNFI